MKGIIRIRFILAAAVLAVLLPATGLLAQVSRAPAGGAPAGRVPLQEDEVRGTPPVQFINRTNRRAADAARQQQFALGQQLATDVVQSDRGNRSRVKIDRVFEGRAAGMGADVFAVEAGAGFGHINVIQRIMTGYLVRAFEYNEADANELSRFILYYNARNRGNMDKVKNTYSPGVISAVNPATVGIDRSYQNWSGKTQILIPLRKSVVRPGDKDIEGRELKKASEALPASERKKLEELLDRRKKDDAQKLDKKEGELNKKAEENKAQQKEIAEQRKNVEGELADTQRKLEELSKDPEANKEQIKEEQKKAEALEEKKEELAGKEEAAKQESKEIASEQKEVAEQKGEEGQKEADAKKEEEMAALKEENKALKEEKKEQAEKTENVVGEKILFLRVVRYLKDGHYKNELWAIDSANDDALYRSSFNNICGREFKVFGDKGVLVAGYKGEFPGHEHNLVLLDSENLGVKSESKEFVYWQSPMIIQEDKVYAIIRRGEEFFIGRFNADLSVDAVSDKPVSKHSTLSLVPGKVYVTGKAEGDRTEILVFAQDTLKQTKTITPKMQ